MEDRLSIALTINGLLLLLMLPQTLYCVVFGTRISKKGINPFNVAELVKTFSMVCLLDAVLAIYALGTNLARDDLALIMVWFGAQLFLAPFVFMIGVAMSRHYRKPQSEGNDAIVAYQTEWPPADLL